MAEIRLKNFKSTQNEEFDKIFCVEPYFKEFYQESEDQSELKNGEETKESWSNQYDYLFQAVSYCVGLGAFWRFPYVAYQNGGGVFLIPFILCLILIGMPMLYLEQAVGQFISRGLIRSWTMTPLFKGVGISMNIINAIVNIYYIMVVAYSIYYLILSFTGSFPDVPWSKCKEEWKDCLDDFTVINCTSTINNIGLRCDDGQCFFPNKTTIDAIGWNFTYLWEIFKNESNINYKNMTEEYCSIIKNTTDANITREGYWETSMYSYASKNYWYEVVLKKSPNMLDFGEPVPYLILVVFVAWILCFLSLFKGIKLSGKISYITTILPYIILPTMLIFSLVKKFEGAKNGIVFFFIGSEDDWNFSKLLNPVTWNEAAVQVFYTLSLSYGG